MSDLQNVIRKLDSLSRDDLVGFAVVSLGFVAEYMEMDQHASFEEAFDFVLECVKEVQKNVKYVAAVLGALGSQ